MNQQEIFNELVGRRVKFKDLNDRRKVRRGTIIKVRESVCGVGYIVEVNAPTVFAPQKFCHAQFFVVDLNDRAELNLIEEKWK